jgi:glycosyltransferase involved in cell wall biosynthesis
MSDGKIDVLFCTDGIFPHAIGGMQRHSRLLVEALASYENIRLHVVHPHIGIKVFDNPVINEIAIDYDKSSKIYLIDCYNYSKKVAEVARNFPKAVIYTQGLSLWHCISEFSNRVVINPHGLEAYQTITAKDYWIGFPFRKIFNYLFSKSLYVVSLGGRLTTILEKQVGKNKVVVLSNAVNIPDKISKNIGHPKPLRFLFVGRFALNKGINILAEAVKQLNQEGYEKDFAFDLVGKGPLFETYKQKYNFENFRFAGFADDATLETLYRDDDLFVLPTLFEGMPTVVLEAMARSMPIIVTDVGATLEMVDKSNGYIIEKNDINSLKNAILHYSKLSDNDKTKLSDSSYNKVKDTFSWSHVAKQHASLFAKIHSNL